MNEPRTMLKLLMACLLLAGGASAKAGQPPAPAKASRILFLGNSITLHGPSPKIGWTGNWGMAASAREKDYVHVLAGAIAKLTGNAPELWIENIADFERRYGECDLEARLKKALDFKPDLVVVAIGENVPPLDSADAKARFKESFTRLLTALKGSRQPKIFVRSCFWPNKTKDDIMRESSAAVGAVFVDISGLSKDESNYARSERHFAHAGVAAHPGDRGMKAIADALFRAIVSRDRKEKRQESLSPWWHRYPVYVGDIGRIRPDEAARLHARMVSGNYAADPAWGAYGQQLSAIEAARQFQGVKNNGEHWISWVEGFGECMLYAAALERNPDGSYRGYPGDPTVPMPVRTAWSWEARGVRPGNVLCWIGAHNCINDEDFVPPSLRHERLGLPVPRYPDGREAVGRIPGGQYPVDARVYDACCAKDINGKLTFRLSMFPAAANTLDAATGGPKGPTEGLFRGIVGQDVRRHIPGHKEGDVVYAAAMNIPKDAAAPFWIDAIRVSVRQLLRRGVDGVWCDNFSPWDNFGQFDRAFGDWSECRFREFLARRLSAGQRRQMGIGDPASFQIRDYLKKKAAQFKAKDPSDLNDPVWTDPRWLDDPVWNAYKVFKQQVGQETLKRFYRTIKEEARRAGRPDFLVAGNDMPLFGLGWVRDDYLDMVSSELMPRSYLTTGPRGILLPPLGKSAVVYRAALEHQQGPYCTIWYYLNGPYAKYQGKPELAKVLMAEAFANGAFLKCGGTPEHPGTPESVAWWNAFVSREEPRFGRRVPVADVGILFSPDNQLALRAPAGPPDAGRQPHSFGHWGFATAMIDAHVPYRAVADWKLNARSLEGLRTFVIPNARWLDDPILPVLENWVRGGGRLVVTGPSGTRHGAAGLFAPRTASLLAPLTGDELPAPGKPGSLRRRSLGQGTVIWTPEPLGMQYYVRENERASLLGRIMALVGESAVLDGRGLPATIGAFCWKSEDGRAIFVDLMNYHWDAGADRVVPAENVRFRLHRPPGAGGAAAITLSPDALSAATVDPRQGWFHIRLPKLLHFASIKVTLESKRTR